MDAPFASPRLQFVAPLGSGGTADVAKAYVADLRRYAAVKYPLPDPEAGVDFLSLAKREHHLIGSATFPGIVNLLERPSQQPPFILLELCEGPTLDTVGRVTDSRLLVTLLSSLALSLEYLNAAGLVHGDIKPQNFFLPPAWKEVSDGRLFWARLSDFSLGKQVSEDDSTRLGIGTLGYAAPETLAENITSHQSDLFALGVIAYQLACGQHPFLETSSDPVEINDRIQSGEFQPLDQRCDIPGALTGLIHQLLQVDPANRPRCGWEVCRTLADVGSPYPFSRALRPAHLMGRQTDYQEAITKCLSSDDLDRDRLDELTGSRVDRLRLLMTANFVRDNLIYEGGRLHFTGRIYWPACFRRRLLHQFSSLAFNDKKAIVQSAVIGNTPDAGFEWSVAKSLPALLLPLLRQQTVKRISAGRGQAAVVAENHKLAARLFLQAGQLEPAEQHAEQAAMALHREHSNREAVHLLDHVLEFASDSDQLFSVRHILMTRADILKQSGEADRALQAYQRIIGLYKNRSPDKILAETYKDIGDIYKMKQQADEGLEALRSAMRIYEELDDELEVSHTLNNMGNLYFHKGDHDKLLTCFRKALHIQRRHNAIADVASTLNNLGAVYVVRGRYRRAIRILEIALPRQREIGDPGEIARTLNNIGYIHMLRGQSREAENYLRESLGINRRIGSKKEVLHNLDNLSSGLISAGRLKESLEFLEEGLALSTSAGLRTMQGAFQLKLGTVCKRQGRIREALECFDFARDAFDDVDDVEDSWMEKVQRASLVFLLGDNRKARIELLQLLPRAKELDLARVELDILLFLTRFDFDIERMDRAKMLCDEMYLSRERVLLDFNLVEAYLTDGRTDAAAKLAGKLYNHPFLETEDIEVARTSNVLGDLALDSADVDRATVSLDRALRAGRLGELLPELVTTYSLLGRLEIQQGNFETSFSHFRNALGLARRIAGTIDDESLRQTYQSTRTVVSLVENVKQLQNRLGGTSAPAR